MADQATFWTFTINGVESTAEDLSVTGIKLQRESLEEDKLTFTVSGWPFDADDEFPYLADVVVQRDRVLSGGGFSGGSIYFHGTSLGGRRSAHGKSEDAQYTVVGPFWWFKQDCYEQLIPALGGFTTHVVLNLNATIGLLWSIQYQLIDILNDALAKYGAIFQYDPAALAEYFNSYVPSDEKRDLTHAEAIKEELKWSPRSVAWFDYTQNPPLFQIAASSMLESTTLDLVNGATVTSADIVPRYDMQVSQCIIRYEQESNIGGNRNLFIFTDTYPASTTSKTGIMRATINVAGISGSEQFATLQTADLASGLADNSIWFSKCPELRGYTNLVIHDTTFTGPSSGEIVIPQTYEIVEGSFHNWMQVGNSQSGAAGIQQDVHVEALADYTDEWGRVIQNEEIKFKAKTTNLSSGTYSRIKVTSWAEPIPGGLAELFYSLLSVLPWEGEVSVELDEVSAQQFLGRRLNLLSGLEAWTTMLAPVQSVTEDIDEGRVTIKFGANKWLSPEQLVDILRVTRYRGYSFYASTMTSGALENDDVLSPDNLPKENSTRGTKRANKEVISHDTGSGPTLVTTTAFLDAINQVISLSTSDGLAGSVQISLADLQANDDMN